MIPTSNKKNVVKIAILKISIAFMMILMSLKNTFFHILISNKLRTIY